jgi:hypothetical protein
MYSIIWSNILKDVLDSLLCFHYSAWSMEQVKYKYTISVH